MVHLLTLRKNLKTMRSPVFNYKVIRIIIIVLLTHFFALAQSQGNQANSTTKTISMGRDHPGLFKSGMINFGDTILVDETETLINEWLDFIFYNNPEYFPSYLKKEDFSQGELLNFMGIIIDSTLLPVDPQARELILKLMPSNNDTLEIKKINFGPGYCYLQLNIDSVQNKQYMRSVIDILNTPITGITYEQANSFCRWRTYVDSLRVFDSRYNIEKYMVREIECYIYRLLSPEEFDLYNHNRDSISKNNKWSTFNYKNALPPKKAILKINNINYGKSLLPVGAYMFHRDKGEKLLDIQGNALELITIKGIAKGGSYMHPASNSIPGISIRYGKPEPYLGFRCCAIRRIYQNEP
jgi:hypothetical protein